MICPRNRANLNTVLNLSHFEQLESYIPLDLNQMAHWPLALLVLSGFVLFRYFLLVGAFYLYFWWPQKPWAATSLYSTAGRGPQIRAEIFWSSMTAFIFAAGGLLTGWLWQNGWTAIYLNFSDYPLWYWPLSLLLFSLAHEVYFYWTHRLMHHPRLYRVMHHTHHLSREPSPWASFCFHPYEALIESLVLPILVCVIPIHPTAFICYLTLMTVSAINNHLGFELMPRFLLRRGWHRHLISGTNHAAHHRHYTCNFGLYYTFMDRLFGTYRPNTVE